MEDTETAGIARGIRSWRVGICLTERRTTAMPVLFHASCVGVFLVRIKSARVYLHGESER